MLPIEVHNHSDAVNEVECVAGVARLGLGHV